MSQKHDGVGEHSEITVENRSVVEVAAASSLVPAVAVNANAPAPRRKPLDVYLRKYTACTLFASLGGFVFGFDTGEFIPLLTQHRTDLVCQDLLDL